VIAGPAHIAYKERTVEASSRSGLEVGEKKGREQTLLPQRTGYAGDTY